MIDATEKKHYDLDPKTGIRKIADWGPACARGFVSNSRFSPTDTVIPRTNRQTTRKWRSVDKGGSQHVGT